MIGLSGGIDTVEILNNSKCPLCKKKGNLLLISTYAGPTVLGILYKINPFKIRENWIVSCLGCGQKTHVTGGIANKLRAKEGENAQRNQ